AVGVLEAVLVLRLVRALVVLVGDAVAIVVGIGAAVLVLEAVLVLRLVGALVDRVGDAVAVAIGEARGEPAAAGLRRPHQAGRDADLITARAERARADHEV